jgi:hypothetical protein
MGGLSEGRIARFGDLHFLGRCHRGDEIPLRRDETACAIAICCEWMLPANLPPRGTWSTFVEISHLDEGLRV